jgi:hypothetical protein
MKDGNSIALYTKETREVCNLLCVHRADRAAEQQSTEHSAGHVTRRSAVLAAGRDERRCYLTFCLRPHYIKPDASGLVALVIDIDIGGVPMNCQLCVAVGMTAVGSPEFDITRLGPVAHPSILLAVFPSGADNSQTDRIAFPLVIANLLEIDVDRLLAFMAGVHFQHHINI